MKAAHWRVGQWKCHPPENLISILPESANEAVACTGSLSQGDHVLNRLPLVKYSWAEIYSLIFHYLLSLYFAYIRSLELLLVTITFVSHFPVWGCSQFCVDCSAYMRQINESSLRLRFFYVVVTFFCLRWKSKYKIVWWKSQSEFSGFLAQGLKWEWSLGDHTHQQAHWGLTGSLHQHRCLSHFHLSIRLQIHQQTWTNRQ